MVSKIIIFGKYIMKLYITRNLLRWIGIELKEWRNAQWADTIESLNPEDQS